MRSNYKICKDWRITNFCRTGNNPTKIITRSTPCSKTDLWSSVAGPINSSPKSHRSSSSHLQPRSKGTKNRSKIRSSTKSMVRKILSLTPSLTGIGTRGTFCSKDSTKALNWMNNPGTVWHPKLLQITYPQKSM